MINNSLSTVSVNTTQYMDITYNVGSIEGTVHASSYRVSSSWKPEGAFHLHSHDNRQKNTLKAFIFSTRWQYVRICIL